MTPEQMREVQRFLAAVDRKVGDGNNKLDQQGERLDQAIAAIRDVADAQSKLESRSIQIEESQYALVAEIRLLRQRVDRHGKRMRTVESFLSVEVDPTEITSTHDLKTISEEVKTMTAKEARRESFATFFKKKSLVFTFTMLSLLFAGCGTTAVELIRYFTSKGHP